MNNKILKYNFDSFCFALLFILNIIIFYLVFGDRFLDPNSWLYTNSYDGIKNYYNYLFYTQVQEGNGLLSYTGMNYPFVDHILYTDSTPVLAMMVKLMGLEKIAVQMYNNFFLLNYLLAPVVAYKIGQHLGFKSLVNIVFSLVVVWLHPMVFNMGEWVNLSMSLYFLAGIYLSILLYKSSRVSYPLLAGLFLLIVFVSLTHLYYLPLMVFLLGGFFAWLLLVPEYRLKAISGLLTLLVSAVSVFLFVKLSDPLSASRPTEVLGYNAPGLTCAWSDYFKSYECLSLPALFQQEDWNIEKLTFLGSAFPLIILITLYSIYTNKLWKISRLKNGRHQLFTAIFTGSLICYFTSLGTKLEIFNDNIKIYNFLNPLNILSEISDTFKNFRSMARFSLPAFTGLIICGFYVVDRFLRSQNNLYLRYIVTGIILITYLIDTTQMSLHARKGAKQPNIFSIENNNQLPELQAGGFDAILPLPYYHVGTEKKGYIIDDNNFWSRETYRRALHYKLPLMSCKLSRTPVYTAEELFSLFQETHDAHIMDLLNGKKILIIEDTVYKKINIDTEPAKTISVNHEVFLARINPKLLAEKDGVRYYELEF